MCDVFSRLFKDSTEPKSVKLHRCYEDDKRRETENIQILKENHKLSTKPISLEDNNPFDIQKVNLNKISSRTQNQVDNKIFAQSLSKSLNKKENEFISPNLNFLKNKKKTTDNFRTPRKEFFKVELADTQQKYNLSKTLNNSMFSNLSKQNNLSFTLPRAQPQLQIRHLELTPTDNVNHSTSRSQNGSASHHNPCSSLSSRSLNKMKIKMKNGRFLSKSEVDNDFSNIGDEKISPQRLKKQITQIENTINANREKMRLGLGEEMEDDKSVKKDNKKPNKEQITPKLRKTSKSITPNLVQIKKVNQIPRPLLLNGNNKNNQNNPKTDLNDFNIQMLNLNLNDHSNSNSDEQFDLYEDLDSRLNSTLIKNLKGKIDSEDYANLDEKIDFDDHFKKTKKSQFGKKFDFLFGEDEMIQHKNLNDEVEKTTDKELIMIDQNFWNLHMAHLIPTDDVVDENDQEESSKEDEQNASSENPEDRPIIPEMSLNSPMEQTASNAVSSTLFSWELAGFTNCLSDMQLK